MCFRQGAIEIAADCPGEQQELPTDCLLTRREERDTGLETVCGLFDQDVGNEEEEP